MSLVNWMPAGTVSNVLISGILNEHFILSAEDWHFGFVARLRLDKHSP